MITHLRGILTEKRPPSLVVDVNGIGYEVEAPMSTFYRLPELQQEVKLLTHLVIREDAHILFGFSSETERQMFRTLIKVNGVGPKLALSILSAMELETFIHCVQQGDLAKLIKIPGVGKKTAERLVIETRDRLAQMPGQSSQVIQPQSLTQGVTSAVDDAISALIALGYKAAEANQMVNAIKQEGLTSEALIRRALQKAL
jgi:Holliday junction DNA helicase RuvA